MPIGTVDTSMYKTNPPADPFAMATHAGQAANALAPLVVGQAMQGAIDPSTGQVDQNKLLTALQQSPVGASQAVPTMDALQRLRSAGFAADQAGLETFQKRMATVSHLFAPLASMDNPTIKDVYNVAAAARDPALGADKFGITLPVIMNTIKQFRDPKTNEPLPSAQIKKKALEIQTQAATTQEILAAHSPQVQWVNQGGQMTLVPTGTKVAPAAGTGVPMQLTPQTPIATSEGQRYLGQQPAVPGGGAVGPDGQPIVAAPPAAGVPAPAATGPAATLAPGYGEAAATIGGQSGASANALTSANDTSMTRKAMLGNLEDDMKKFVPGPGADWTKLAKAWTNRNLPVPKSWQDEGGILDVKSIASQEQFVKQAQMLAQQQFQAIGGTGTDAKFNSAFTTNPNDLLSQLGNQGIIRLLKGNEDALQAKTREWQQWLKAGNGPQTYPQFSIAFNGHFDPRVFQFRYMSPAERQAYINNMDPADHGRFLTDLAYARKKGWVDFGGGK